MTTFPVLNRDLLQDDDQRAFWDEVTQGARGFYCGGPESKRIPDLYNAWLQFPQFARAIFQIADAVRTGCELPGKLRELLVLVTCARLGARVEFDFHVPFAEAEGLSGEFIAAVRAGRKPPFADEGERIAYEANVQLLQAATLSDRTREELVAHLGYRGLVHLVATMVVYVATAYTMNISNARLAENFSVDPGKLRDFFTGRVADAP